MISEEVSEKQQSEVDIAAVNVECYIHTHTLYIYIYIYTLYIAWAMSRSSATFFNSSVLAASCFLRSCAWKFISWQREFYQEFILLAKPVGTRERPRKHMAGKE